MTKLIDYLNDKIKEISEFNNKFTKSPLSKQNSLLKIHLIDFALLLKQFYDAGIQKNFNLQQQEAIIKTKINNLYLKPTTTKKFLQTINLIDKFIYEIILLKKITLIKEEQSIILNPTSLYKCYCYSNHPKNCSNKIIKAHTISNTNNFQENVKYFSYSSSLYNYYVLNKLEYKEIGADSASVGLIFCGDHDREIFAPIEQGNSIDLNNPLHYRLQNYRAYYKKEVEDLEKHLIYTELSKEITNLSNNIIIKNISEFPEIKQSKGNSLSLNNLNTLEHGVFKDNLPMDTLYFSIELNNDVLYLTSTSGDGSYLDPTISEGKSNIFFHILQNNKTPCIIFSAFDTSENKQILTLLKSLYNNNLKEFWELIVSFSCLNNNIFFKQDFMTHPTMPNKFKSYAQIDNEYVVSGDYINRPFFNTKIKLTLPEINFLFNVKNIHDNI